MKDATIRLRRAPAKGFEVLRPFRITKALKPHSIAAPKAARAPLFCSISTETMLL